MSNQQQQADPISTRGVVVVLLLFGAILFGMSMVVRCTRVDTSEFGIKFSKLSLSEQGTLKAVRCNGYVFYCPITTDVFTYPVYVQRVDYSPFNVTTKDAATFTMDPLIAYSLNPNKAIDVFAKYRRPLSDIQEGYMRTVIYDAYRISANRYTSDELMANRAKFEEEVRMMLTQSLETEGFVVSEFTSQITPPPSLAAAIDAKNTAIQESLKAENLVRQAEAQAKIEVAKAEGEAQALRIKADGEAYYNRTVAASLNALLVQQYAIEKWDGKLPTYNGGNNVPLINLKP